MFVGINGHCHVELLKMGLAIRSRLALAVTAGAGPPVEHEEQEENGRHSEQFDQREGGGSARFSQWEPAEILGRAAHVFQPALHEASIPQKPAAGNGELKG